MTEDCRKYTVYFQIRKPIEGNCIMTWNQWEYYKSLACGIIAIVPLVLIQEFIIWILEKNYTKKYHVFSFSVFPQNFHKYLFVSDIFCLFEKGKTYSHVYFKYVFPLVNEKVDVFNLLTEAVWYFEKLF